MRCVKPIWSWHIRCSSLVYSVRTGCVSTGWFVGESQDNGVGEAQYRIQCSCFSGNGLDVCKCKAHWRNAAGSKCAPSTPPSTATTTTATSRHAVEPAELWVEKCGTKSENNTSQPRKEFKVRPFGNESPLSFLVRPRHLNYPPKARPHTQWA